MGVQHYSTNNKCKVKNIPKSSGMYVNMKILHNHNEYLLRDSPVNTPRIFYLVLVSGGSCSSFCFYFIFVILLSILCLYLDSSNGAETSNTSGELTITHVLEARSLIIGIVQCRS